MSYAGMAGMRATLGDVSGLIGALDDGEWATAKRGRRLDRQGRLRALRGPARHPRVRDRRDPRYRSGHRAAQRRARGGEVLWSPGRVSADLERQAAALLPVLESLQEEPNASTEAQLLDLGSYPVHAIPDMFSFDFYTHLRWDVLAPRGPLTGHDVPAPDEVRVKPAVGWLLAGIPKMQAGIRDSLAKPVTLALTGPGGDMAARPRF